MNPDTSDTFKQEGEPKSAAPILAAVRKAERAFNDWQVTSQTIDEIYSLRENTIGAARYDWRDSEMDIFWSSFEVMKEAVYARPPQPVVVPLFKDNSLLNNKTAELLERCAIGTFKNADINDVMLQCRDDLLFAGRSVMWLRHEVEKGKHKVCIEHVDRADFLYEPCRYWREVGWLGRAFWLTQTEVEKRFKDTPKAVREQINYTTAYDERASLDGRDLQKEAVAKKAKIWEIWHKADNRVYFVADGVDKVLEEREPHVQLEGFWPCPKPAFGTLQRRSLIPVPDYQRYSTHFHAINDLTRRMLGLLDRVRMKGLIPSGGTVGDAVEQLLADDSDDTMLIPVEGMGLMQNGGRLVEWLPLADIAQAISTLFEARAQLINDYYELSGISDIMRGATEASETLGAQQLKSQYGAVRVRAKSSALQQQAAEAVKIAAEIIAEKFPKDQILEMAQMDIPTDKDIKKRVKEIENAAEAELSGLAQQAERQLMQAQQSEQQVDPAQAQQQLEQQQQQVLQKYATMLAEVDKLVPQEDVFKLLRDDRTRCFTFEIESSSTILTDELSEKQSRNEFLTVFSNSIPSFMEMSGLGEAAAKLAGGTIKFALAPYRAGRELDGLIDEFIDQAPQMAQRLSEQGGESEELAQAQKALADAEMAKAQAANMKVQVDAQRYQVEAETKMQKMQMEATEKEAKFMLENGKLELAMQKQQQEFALQIEKMRADIDRTRAETAKILESIGLDVRRQQLEEYKVAENSQQRQVDNQLAMSGEQRAERGEERADRSQQFGEQQAMEQGE